MSVSGHKHDVIETKESETKTKKEISNMKFILTYSHHSHLQSKT